MATWLIITLGIVGFIAVGVIAFIVWRKTDKAIDDKQRQINKLENEFAKCGASWMAELLEDIVVGDSAALVGKLRHLIEGDTVLVFNQEIAIPITRYTMENNEELRKELLAKYKSKTTARRATPAKPAAKK